MESNFKELKMKLTKADLVKEYSTAIGTIESKDAELNKLQKEIDDIKNLLKNKQKDLNVIQNDLTNAQAALKNEQAALKNEQAVLKNEQAVLKNEQATLKNEQAKVIQAKDLQEKSAAVTDNTLIDENKDLIRTLSDLLYSFELVLKLNQTANDTAVHMFSKSKDDILKKWGIK